MVIPRGSLKLDAEPLPFAEPASPVPAKVVTAPKEVIFLIKLLLESATYTFPFASTAIPLGYEKLAAVPVPFEDPTEPLPATVVTTPADVIFRILLL